MRLLTAKMVQVLSDNVSRQTSYPADGRQTLVDKVTDCASEQLSPDNVGEFLPTMANQGARSEPRERARVDYIMLIKRMHMGYIYSVGECLTVWTEFPTHPQHS